MEDDVKKVLLVYYPQTGQLAELAWSFAEPLRQGGIHMDCVSLEPQEPYPFPWSFWRFLNTFPETIHLKPAPILPPAIPTDDYGTMVIAYTVWFLSPAQPITAFLQWGETYHLLNNKPVITFIGCHNTWSDAREKMKSLLAQNGMKLIGNIVRIDARNSAVSLIITPTWLLSGDKQCFHALPSAGIADRELAGAVHFGAKVRDTLSQNKTLDETLFQNISAARINEKLIFSEKTAGRSFFLWGRLLMAAGHVSPLLRHTLLCFYVLFLLTMVLVLVPVSVLVRELPHPLFKGRLKKLAGYYGQPFGERIGLRAATCKEIVYGRFWAHLPRLARICQEP